jgi:hypothetical protein
MDEDFGMYEDFGIQLTDDDYKGEILDYLVRECPSSWPFILGSMTCDMHGEWEDEYTEYDAFAAGDGKDRRKIFYDVTIADIYISIREDFYDDDLHSYYKYSIGGIYFKDEEYYPEEYFRVLHESKNSDLYRQILLKLEFVDRGYRDKMEVTVRFCISRGKSVYEYKISKRHEPYFGDFTVFEILTRKKLWRWGEDYSNKEIALSIIGRTFGDEIKEEVASRVEKA